MNEGSTVALKEFGANFLSPMLNVFIRSIVQESHKTHLPLCLAREGYILDKAIQKLTEKGLIQLPVSPLYLKVSRTLLFKALLGESSAWEVLLKPSFEGTVQELFRSRFTMTLDEIDRFLPADTQKEKISLPDDMDYMVQLFSENHLFLRSYASPTRQAVLNYFHSVGLDDPSKIPLFLDVGYAGTIQKLITLLLRRDTDGLYLIASNSGVNNVDGFAARMKGILKENVEFGEHYPLLERSLFLESIMTAPHGQVIDIREYNDGTFEFIYGRSAPAQRYAQNLGTLHDGAIEHLVYCYENDIVFDPSEVEALYEAYVTSPGAIPKAGWHLFAADDEITGNGIVNPLTLFGMA